jgi:hypothetical protein
MAYARFIAITTPVDHDNRLSGAACHAGCAIATTPQRAWPLPFRVSGFHRSPCLAPIIAHLRPRYAA